VTSMSVSHSIVDTLSIVIAQARRQTQTCSQSLRLMVRERYMPVFVSYFVPAESW